MWRGYSFERHILASKESICGFQLCVRKEAARQSSSWFLSQSRGNTHKALSSPAITQLCFIKLQICPLQRRPNSRFHQGLPPNTPPLRGIGNLAAKNVCKDKGFNRGDF